MCGPAPWHPCGVQNNQLTWPNLDDIGKGTHNVYRPTQRIKHDFSLFCALERPDWFFLQLYISWNKSLILSIAQRFLIPHNCLHGYPIFLIPHNCLHTVTASSSFLITAYTRLPHLPHYTLLDPSWWTTAASVATKTLLGYKTALTWWKILLTRQWENVARYFW